ncbi:hypothetical protein HNR23_003137 [Nocardiopsis mwathae]|uniref:CBM2 domain-containing protein n=1 Tax=Nocardiopsis mwathae TaxID=1472723 RepID=A0A7W9YJ75_9ACTN|nr:hypothetical protein [Nocardiopsis mwathae]
MLESTVPKRVQPPRLLTVLLISGVTLALTLFGYSTTQIYLRFSDPPAGNETGPGAGTSERLEPPKAESSASAVPDGGDQPRSAAGTAPPGQGASASGAVTYRIVETTDTGFTGAVTITNTSPTALESWELVLGFADLTLGSAWDASWETTPSGLIARPLGGQAALAPGDSVTMYFTAEGSARNPTSCSLNGDFCDL